ncbi:MAG TPA: PRC-barrel domain-containing protein, partial [Bryobacteraceae bacterium]|nr:PRC-barrel domain-containing protein [Bryobacteraceae bacterium]
MRHSRNDDHVGRSRTEPQHRDAALHGSSFYGLGRFSMADEFLFLTELLGLKVYDLKGRRLGLV